MKELLVIVPGSKTKINPLFRKPLEAFYTHYGVSTNNRDWANEFKTYMNGKGNYDTDVFYWSGGVTKRYSLKPAADKLASEIDRRASYDSITLLGKSLGGIVAELAIHKVQDRKRIKKIIYVATPHAAQKKELPSTVSVTNVYSPQDNYLDFAIKVLYFGQGVKDLSNAENIRIPNMRHSDFTTERALLRSSKETTLFDFYEELITK